MQRSLSDDSWPFSHVSNNWLRICVLDMADTRERQQNSSEENHWSRLYHSNTHRCYALSMRIYTAKKKNSQSTRTCSECEKKRSILTFLPFVNLLATNFGEWVFDCHVLCRNAYSVHTHSHTHTHTHRYRYPDHFMETMVNCRKRCNVKHSSGWIMISMHSTPCRIHSYFDSILLVARTLTEWEKRQFENIKVFY